MGAAIRDSSTGYFDTRLDLGRLPHAQRRRLTPDERRERSRAYTRACRSKQAREKLPSSAVVQRAAIIALLDALADKNPDVPLRTIMQRMYALLKQAGYRRSQILERLDRIELFIRRNP